MGLLAGIAVGLSAACLVLLLLVFAHLRRLRGGDAAQDAMERRLMQRMSQQQLELGDVLCDVRTSLDRQTGAQRQELQNVNLQVLEMSKLNRASIEDMRRTLDGNLRQLAKDNADKLEAMRTTVDEKLQATLERRLSDSFGLVNQRLEQVYKGLGEMNQLAGQMGDLQKVLSNVKVRGTWGEVQLAALMQQMLSPAQFSRNVATHPGGRERVDFAVNLPDGPADGPLLLPIDCKFPQEDFLRLVECSQTGDPAQVEAAAKKLEQALTLQAKSIAAKYIHPPHTTDFAILYLATEGLYAEAVRREGLLAKLQTAYRVTVAGPSTLTALLSSLQMGFRTLAVQRSADEIRNIFEQFRKDFATFDGLLEKTQRNLGGVLGDIDAARTRTARIDKRLQAVQQPSALPEEAAP